MQRSYLTDMKERKNSIDSVMKKGRGKFWLLFAVAIIGLAVSIILASSLGAFQVDPKTTYEILLYKIFGIGGASTQELLGSSNYNVIWLIRFPRILLGIIVGAGLALCGCVMQACVRNPLAEPYILGISSGASLGATFSIMLGIGGVQFLNISGVSFWSFLGAMGAAIFVLTLSVLGGKATSTKLILSGTVINAICTAFSNFIISVGSNKEGMQSIKFWTMGSLASAKWDSLWVPCLATGICALFFLTQTRKLNAMLMGDEVALTLGIHLNRSRYIYMILVSLLTGVLVSYCGIIGFVGLMIPHVVRALVGSDHRRLVPLVLLLGAIFLVWADAIARIIIPNAELAIGIVTGMIGAPFFAYILIRKSYGYGE